MRRGKFNARRTWSARCDRWFPSRAEACRAEELTLLQDCRAIRNLEFQPRFELGGGKRYTADFRYEQQDGQTIIEDVKGILTRDTATRLAWLTDKHGVRVTLLRAIYRRKDIVGWQRESSDRKMTRSQIPEIPGTRTRNPSRWRSGVRKRPSAA